MRDDYRATYQQIAADHIAYWRSTGNNPWQSGEHVGIVGDATRDLLRRYSAPGDAILDAGCGMGELTVPLSDRELHGVDFAPAYVEIAATRITAVIGDLEALPYPDGRFALVVAADVLEHVLDLNAVVAECLRVLRPGGVFVVRVPERENLGQYLTDANPYRFVHLRRFDRASLELLFTRIFPCEVPRDVRRPQGAAVRSEEAMKILITGIAGFIGSHLADALTAQGHHVSGIDNLSTGRSDNVETPFLLGDIADGVPQADWDVIYHCAASYKDRAAWERDASTNLLGTLNVIREAQRAHARLIYFQTSLCYGPSPASPVGVGSPLDPHGSYAISKTAGESYIRDSGLDYVSLRLANVYGPRNLSGPVPVFYQRLAEGLPCTVVDSRRDFIFIDDLVALALEALTKGSGVYHASSGSDVSIATVYGAVAKAMGIDAPLAAVTPRGPDDVATLLLDPAETYLEYGWAARTPLPEGIAKAVAWYQEHGVADTYTHLAAAR